jgi:hypothetical protein
MKIQGISVYPPRHVDIYSSRTLFCLNFSPIWNSFYPYNLHFPYILPFLPISAISPVDQLISQI